MIPGLGRSAGEGLSYPLLYSWAPSVAQLVKKSTCKAEDLGLIPGLERSPREGNSYPLQYSGLENSTNCIVHGEQKESDTAEQLSVFFFLFASKPVHQRRQWHPTPVLLPGESQERGSLVGCCLWGRTESDTTEVT